MQKLDIAILVPGLPFDGNTIKTKGLGGSETAGYYMGRELAALGNNVTMFTNTDKPAMIDGVLYAPYSQGLDYIRTVPHDVTIVQRSPEVFVNPTNSRLNVLWQHDLALGRNDGVIRGVLWNVDRIALVSNYHKEQYESVHNIDNDVFMVTRNGVDLDLINSLRETVAHRDYNKLIYAARPERGLDVLLTEIFPRLLEKNPNFKLYVAGYNNPVDHFKTFYDFCNQEIKKYGESIIVLGELSKEELYKHYLTAGCYVYPTPSPIMPTFNEVSCISAIEAQACGLPIVTTARGALPETINQWAGYLINQNEQYVENFVKRVYEICTDIKLFSGTSYEGINHSQSYNWREIAKEWQETFVTQIESFSKNNDSLIRDFIRNSDIVAAKEMIKRGYEPAADVVEELQNYNFMEETDGYKKQYEHIGSTHDKTVFSFTVHEQRLGILTSFLNTHTDIKNILDYGCAHGSYAIHTSNAIGNDRYVTGIDIDYHGIEIAKEYVSEGKAKYPDMLRFSTVDKFHEINTKNYDCLVVQEILEHVPEPWAFIDELEKNLAPGAKVYITVPYGPWEYDSYKSYPWRAHIWHFDMHDIRDMFSNKANLAVGSMYNGNTRFLNKPAGWWIIEYTVNGKPSKPINMDRKLTLQRPRQTVSACLMAGPNSEEQLHWCLRSLEHIADEIVIVDTGMNEAAKHIISQYSDRNVFIVDNGPDVRSEGFETGRNAGLAECEMEWVFWIDTDEKVIDGFNIQKYLRENCFNGYGVRQMHFACDTNFAPDMPVRLFRNRPYKGDTMRFYGMIHEHPELGLNKGPGEVIVLFDVTIAHTGYLSEDIRRGRFNRNYPLLQKDKETYPDRLLQKHFIMRDNMLICGYILKSNGGVITNEIRVLCEEVVTLYTTHFLGKKHYANVDSVNWYSQALELLGRGVTVHFGINAGREGAQPPENKLIRYETKDAFLKDFGNIVDSIFDPLENEYY